LTGAVPLRPDQLAWLDEEVRRTYDRTGVWSGFAPAAVTRVARISAFDPAVVGLLACHANGFVRAAALEVLAGTLDGRELPFLALRANDWVEPVARGRASS
jgi:hypothetical protein